MSVTMHLDGKKNVPVALKSPSELTVALERGKDR